MNNKRQGVIGLMCNESGGSNNSNFVRGNEFGLMNKWDMLNEMKKDEYTVEMPVQRPMFYGNQTLVNDKSQFYPTTNYYLSKSKNYKTYPKPNTFTEKGYPKYVYPYKTLNNIENYMNYDINKKYDEFNNYNINSTSFINYFIFNQKKINYLTSL